MVVRRNAVGRLPREGPGRARTCIAAIRGVSRGRLQPMLVELADVCMDPGAGATLSGIRFVSAVALVGATVVDRVMAGAVLREQECPRGFIRSIEDAREWLNRLPAPQALGESPV